MVHPPNGPIPKKKKKIEQTLIHVSTWMDLKCILLRERNQTSRLISDIM